MIGLLAALAALNTSAAEVLGRVIVDDGLPPATPIRVELRCAGAQPVVGAGGPEGRFALAASAGRDCTIGATLAGYSGDAIPLERLPLDPEIAGLALRREGKWQGYALSSTTLAASEQALAHYAAAARALRAGGEAGMAEAERLFASAAADDSNYAEAWFQLGRMGLARGDLVAARMALRAALAADPWFVSPYRPLLMLELAEERWSDGRALCDQWLRLSPDFADARFYRALAALELDDAPAAREDLRAIEAGPEAASFAPLHYLRGRVFEANGGIAEALAEYRTYLAAEPEGAMAHDAHGRLAGAAGP